MNRNLVILCIVPAVILSGAFLLYFTRNSADVQVNELDTRETEFLTLSPLQFGELAKIRKIDLYNSEIKISNIQVDYPGYSLNKDEKYDCIISPEKENARLTINYKKENMNDNKIDFIIKTKKTEFPIPIKVSLELNKLELLIKATVSKKHELIQNEIIFDKGLILPVPGHKNDLIEYDLVSKFSKIKFAKAGNKETLELPTNLVHKDEGAILNCKFSKYSKIEFKTFNGTDGAKMGFFFDSSLRDSTMCIFQKESDGKKDVIISNPSFLSVKDQNEKLIISYSPKNEFLPVIRKNDEILIQSDNLTLTEPIKLKNDQITISLEGSSKDVRRKGTQLIESNFDTVPKFFTAVIIIIAYVIDKIITVFEFIRSNKNVKHN